MAIPFLNPNAFIISFTPFLTQVPSKLRPKETALQSGASGLNFTGTGLEKLLNVKGGPPPLSFNATNNVDYFQISIFHTSPL